MKSPSCETCVYWDRSTWVRLDENDTNACRRFPPTRVNSSESEFPETYVNDWCGEYEREETRARKKKK